MGAPLGVIQDLLVGPPAGALHPGRQPIHAHRLADLGHLRQPFAQVLEGGHERPVGLAQPVQHHRTQGVQPDLQRQRRGAALATAAGWAQVREALGSQRSTSMGRDERGRYDNGDWTSWKA